MRQNHHLTLGFFTNPIDDQLYIPLWTGMQWGRLSMNETVHLQPACQPHQTNQEDSNLQALFQQPGSSFGQANMSYLLGRPLLPLDLHQGRESSFSVILSIT